MTEIGNRVRVGLSSPQPLVAEVTVESIRIAGAASRAPESTATWKATATRLVRALANRRSGSSNAVAGGSRAR